MPLFKNVASQKLAVYAHDTSADAPKTGDAANITAQISLNGGATAATNDTNPTELDATDAPGIYIFDLTQAETNANLVIVSAVSSTADIAIEPVIVYTEPETLQEVAKMLFRSVKVLFASPAGNSSNDGLTPSTAKDTIANAFAAATADSGHTVVALAGEYNLSTTPVVQPSGVHFTGAGRGATRIFGTADMTGASGGVLFKCGSETRSTDFSVSCTGGATRGAIGFNAASPASQAVARDFVLERVDAYGQSDGLYVRESSDTTPADSYFQAWDCDFRSAWDPVMLFNNASLQADFNNCRLITHGDDSLTVRSINVVRGTARMSNCQLIIDSEINLGLLAVNALEVGISGTATTARLSMANCAMSQIYRETSSVNEAAYKVYDGGKLKLVNTVFDRSLTQTVSGSGASASIIDIGGTGAIQSTTIATLASQTSFTLTAGSADNDAYNNLTIVITDATTSTQKAVGTISDYVGSTKTVTLAADPGIFTMAAGDRVEILAGGGASSAQDAKITQIHTIVQSQVR